MPVIHSVRVHAVVCAGLIATATSCGSAPDEGVFGSSLEGGTGGSAGADASAGGGAGEGGDSAGGTSGAGGSGASSGAGGSGGSTGGSGSTATGGAPPAGGSGGSGSCVQESLWTDADGDGFGDPGAPVTACPGAGRVANSDDCYDGNADAKPGQTEFFEAERGDGSFDYNCDDAETQQLTAIGVCSLAICGALQEGWQTSVPPCGDLHPWITTCVGLAICTPQTEQRTQGCQ